MKSGKIYFYYGAMGSSKTAQALMTRFNYEEKNQNALMIKPKLDTRDGEHIVKSRIGLSHPCKYVHEARLLKEDELKKYDVIIIDEAQFLTKNEVYWLVYLADELNIPVICYGLLSDFRGSLFEGSRELVVLADKLIEIKTMCWCGRKASFNARLNDAGEVIKIGDQIVLGANDRYTSLCRKHWMLGDLGPKETKEAENESN